VQIRLKRAYRKPGSQDGKRVLVDRLWPRGVKKEDAKIDLWLKEIAPSRRLRGWFGHAPERWEEFKTRYFCELNGNLPVVRELEKIAAGGRVTLVFGARDAEHNNAVVLKRYLEGRASGR